jgi:hypothetical protein
MSRFVAPRLDIGLSPFTKAVQHRPPSFDDSVTHGLIPSSRLRLTPVVVCGTVVAWDTGNGFSLGYGKKRPQHTRCMCHSDVLLVVDGCPRPQYTIRIHHGDRRVHCNCHT